MVAAVLRLRYRVLGNALARRPWQLVGFVLGALSGVAALVGLVAGMIALAVFQGREAATAVSVLAGALLVLGWVLGPIVVAGMESTVDASRLAHFPLTPRQVMLALTGTGLTGIPGIVTTLGALTSVILWVRWPGAAVAAVPGILLGVLTCVLASRLTGELSGGLGGNRRVREVVGTLVLVVLIFSGPILTGVLSALDSGGGGLTARLAQASQVLPWTPLGAAWSIAPSVAAGEVGAALAHAVIASATVVVLWVVWAKVLSAAVSSPRQRATRTVAAGRLGLFGRMPTGGVGATWARTLTAWLRDPRYLRQLIVVPLFPLLFAFIGGVGSVGFTASAVIAALVLSVVGYADVSYDGTAFGTTLATGLPGRADRLGRVLGAACVGMPLVTAIAVVTVLLGGRAAQLPAILAATWAILLAGYGVCAVSSALIVTPVAAPGDSPFKSVPGQTAIGGLLVFVVWAVVVVVSLPAVVPAAASLLTGQESWGWVALAVAVPLGVGAVAVGIHVGGRTLDRTGPDLLLRIRAFPT